MNNIMVVHVFQSVGDTLDLASKFKVRKVQYRARNR